MGYEEEDRDLLPVGLERHRFPGPTCEGIRGVVLEVRETICSQKSRGVDRLVPETQEFAVRFLCPRNRVVLILPCGGYPFPTARKENQREIETGFHEPLARVEPSEKSLRFLSTSLIAMNGIRNTTIITSFVVMIPI